MPKITFVQSDGEERIVDANIGQSLMEAARDHDVDGILAECGGACACATCHIIVEAAPESGIPAIGDMEAAMLEGALNATDKSRLACQIEVTDQLDGLRVTVPESQF